MKIVHLQHPYIPGKGYQENYLPARQRELGHDVQIVTTNVVPEKFQASSEYSFDSGTYEYKGVPTHRCKSLTYDTEAATLPIGAINKIRKLDPDIIHSHRLISFLSISSICADMLTDAKLIFDIHVDNDNFHLDERYKRLGFQAFKGGVLPVIKRSADGFIAVNPHAVEFLERRLGITNPYLLPLGADAQEFKKSETERRELRSRLGIHDDEFVIITSGNLNESKKIEEIIRSIPIIDSDSVRLIILGEGEDSYVNSLRDVAKETVKEEQITFHDFVDHSKLSGFYNCADLGIWPGKLGITIIEAISCGLPIVVSDTKATEFLIDNENGLTVSEGTPSEIANIIETYKENPSLRKSHSKNAADLVEGKLSWESIAQRSINFYKSV